MQEGDSGILGPEEHSGVSGTVALLLDYLTNKHFQLDKGLLDWILLAFGNSTEERTEAGEEVELVEDVKEKAALTEPLFTADQIQVLRELSMSLENPDLFATAIAKLKSFTDLKCNSQPSVPICLLLARIYQRGHTTLLKADPIQALSYFKTLCEFSTNTKDPFAESGHAYALDRIKSAALKEKRPGAILYLVHYYFREGKGEGNFNAMDQWVARMPDAYRANLEEWFHNNDVHFCRGLLEENLTNIAEIVQEFCRSLIENVNDSNKQVLITAELVKRANRIKNEPLCAVLLLKTLSAMIKDRRFKEELVGQLLDTFELRNLFSEPGSAFPYSLKLAQVYLIIVGSNEKSMQKLKALLEARDEDCINALERLQSEPLPQFLQDHPDFKGRLLDLHESISWPISGVK